jgi:hypothetical protein
MQISLGRTSWYTMHCMRSDLAHGCCKLGVPFKLKDLQPGGQLSDSSELNYFKADFLPLFVLFFGCKK